MEQRLSVVTLGVADLARARAFYEDGLGWRPSSASNDQVVFIQLGGIVLGLYGREALTAEASLTLADGFGGMALAYNVRERTEVDAVLATAEAAGARILKPAAETFWGGYSGYFADPDGHPWEVAHNPFWPIADDGSVNLPP
jgi:catechol 2,3-dioxygenase-like lactoylglutathione lyase family enzyme